MIMVADTTAGKPYDDPMDSSRPRLHVMPPSGWLNDPNGVCRIDETYHVFYQHNPDAPVHGNVHWGHASSADLLHWTHEPIALTPIPGTINAGGCWSGCVVDDGGIPTAVYTAVPDHAWNATVGLARSDRTLRDWVPDPVAKMNTPDDPAIDEVRDPFVFQLDGHRYAVQGAGHHHGDPQLLVYACDDLDDWRLLGPLLTVEDRVAAAEVPANIWECPNLVRLGDRWLLIISQWQHVDGTYRLAGVRYLVGDLVERDGHPWYVAETGGIVDTGPLFYAPQILVEDDRVLLWGWVRESEQRSEQDIEQAGWAGVLTFPRELALGPAGLVSRPAAELVGLRTEELPARADGVIEAAAFEVVSDGPVELVLLDPATGTREVAASTREATRILVDGSIVEAFGTGPSATSRHYPTASSHWEVSASHGYRAWRLG